MSKKLEDIQARCVVKLNDSLDATLTLADTWYTLADATKLIQCAEPQFLSLDSTTGKLTYTGTSDKKLVFIGDSDIKADNLNCKVTFGLFKNGILVPYAFTPSDFTALNRINSIGINDIVPVCENDYLEVRAMCNIAGVTVTIDSFHTTYFSTF